jgi:hypothetical protein
MAKGNPKVGTCRLCGAQGPLEHSHIMSSAAYKRALQGTAGEPEQHQLTKVTQGQSEQTNKQMKEYLLCRVCEERFSKWEAYAFPIMSQVDKTFPWLANVTPGVTEPLWDSSDVDVSKLSLFAASLFWRFSVYRDSQLSLGAVEEPIRQYLLGQSPFPADAVLVVTLLDPSGAKLTRSDRGFSYSDVPARRDGYEAARVTLLGVDLQLFFGQAVPVEFHRLCFVRTAHVLVQPTDAFVMKILAPLILSAPRKPQKAKRPRKK